MNPFLLTVCPFVFRILALLTVENRDCAQEEMKHSGQKIWFGCLSFINKEGGFTVCHNSSHIILKPCVQSHQTSQQGPLCLIEWDDKSPYSFKAELNYCDGSFCLSRAQWRRQSEERGRGERDQCSTCRPSHKQLWLHCRIIDTEPPDKSII